MLNNVTIELLRNKTQLERVLWFLQKYGNITNLQCHELLGIRHAPAVIRDLRKRFKKLNLPFEIINKTKEGINRFGDSARWVEYTLTRKSSK